MAKGTGTSTVKYAIVDVMIHSFYKKLQPIFRPWTPFCQHFETTEFLCGQYEMSNMCSYSHQTNFLSQFYSSLNYDVSI